MLRTAYRGFVLDPDLPQGCRIAKGKKRQISLSGDICREPGLRAGSAIYVHPMLAQLVIHALRR